LDSKAYDINIPNQEEQDKRRIWGVPYLPITNPVVLGTTFGFVTNSLLNQFKKRHNFANVHYHIITSIISVACLKLVYKKYDDYRYEREIVIWDYVKKHPESFPEVFQRKYLHLKLNTYN
jgi:hypothetical protein